MIQQFKLLFYIKYHLALEKKKKKRNKTETKQNLRKSTPASQPKLMVFNLVSYMIFVIFK